MNTCECDECRKYVEFAEQEERKLYEADSPDSPLDDMVICQDGLSVVDDHCAFEKELEDLINRHSMENASDTPDFILAEYMHNCLRTFNSAVQKRETWYGRRTEPAHIPGR